MGPFIYMICIFLPVESKSYVHFRRQSPKNIKFPDLDSARQETPDDSETSIAISLQSKNSC